MKILVQYFYGGGGGIEHFYKLLKTYSLLYTDNQLILVCHPDSKLTQLGDLKNVEVIKYKKSGNKELDRLRLGLYDLVKIAKEKNVDIIWSLNLGNYLSSRFPTVLTVNNAYFVYPFSVHKYHPQNIIGFIFLRLCYSLSARSSNAVVFQTNVMEKCFEERRLSKRKSLFVIPKPVDINDSKYIDSKFMSLAGNIYKFLYISTFTKHKNHKLLVDIAILLKERKLPYSIVLTISKKDFLSLDKYRMNVLQDLLDRKYIILVGWVDVGNIQELYNACNFCLMPSLLESLSSAHIEAMAFKVPQISSDTPFARETCKNACLYANPHDPIDWVNKMQTLESDQSLQNEIIENGTNIFGKLPTSWNDIAIQYNKVFNEIKFNYAKQ